MKLLTTYKGKRRVPDGGVPADLDLIKALAAEARARTEMFTGVKVVSDETQMWAPDWLKAETAHEFVLPRRTVCQIIRRAYTPEPPFTSQPRFDRDALVSMRRDYAELPLFRQTAGDRFEVHKLAWRAPRNVYERTERNLP